MDSVSESQIDELRQQFHVFDVNGSGFIEADELREGLKMLGYQVNDEGFTNLMKVVGSQDDRLNFEEFIAWNRELYKEEMKQEFKAIDVDGSGYIDKVELKEYTLKKNYEITEEALDDLVYSMDSNQNDRIGLDEFITGMAATRTGNAYFVINGEMYIEKLKADFRSMDDDGNGFVTKEELRLQAKQIHYYLSEEELEKTIVDMDEDGDGRISLEEFIAAATRIKTDA